MLSVTEGSLWESILFPLRGAPGSLHPCRAMVPLRYPGALPPARGGIGPAGEIRPELDPCRRTPTEGKGAVSQRIWGYDVKHHAVTDGWSVVEAS